MPNMRKDDIHTPTQAHYHNTQKTTKQRRERRIKKVCKGGFFCQNGCTCHGCCESIAGVARVVSYSHLMCSSTGWEVMENIPTRFAVTFVDEKENWLKMRGMEEKDIDSVMYCEMKILECIDLFENLKMKIVNDFEMIMGDVSPRVCLPLENKLKLELLILKKESKVKSVTYLQGFERGEN